MPVFWVERSSSSLSPSLSFRKLENTLFLYEIVTCHCSEMARSISTAARLMMSCDQTAEQDVSSFTQTLAVLLCLQRKQRQNLKLEYVHICYPDSSCDFRTVFAIRTNLISLSFLMLNQLKLNWCNLIEGFRLPNVKQ